MCGNTLPLPLRQTNLLAFRPLLRSEKYTRRDGIIYLWCSKMVRQDLRWLFFNGILRSCSYSTYLCNSATEWFLGTRMTHTLFFRVLPSIIMSIHPNWVIIDGDCALRHGVMVNEIVLTWLVIFNEYGWHPKDVTQTTWSHINIAEHSLIYRWISDIYLYI